MEKNSSFNSFADRQDPFTTIFDLQQNRRNNTLTITPQPRSISRNDENNTKIIDICSNISENSSFVNKSSFSKTHSVDIKRVTNVKLKTIETKGWPLSVPTLTELRDKRIMLLIQDCRERLKVDYKYQSVDMAAKGGYNSRHF